MDVEVTVVINGVEYKLTVDYFKTELNAEDGTQNVQIKGRIE